MRRRPPDGVDGDAPRRHECPARTAGEHRGGAGAGSRGDYAGARGTPDGRSSAGRSGPVSPGVERSIRPGCCPFPDRNADRNGYDGESRLRSRAWLSDPSSHRPPSPGPARRLRVRPGGLGIEVRDGSGEALWYAVSRNLVNHRGGGVPDPPVQPPGLLDGTPAYPWLRLVDASGSVLIASDGEPLEIAAVIIAPGPPLPGQARTGAAPGPAHYLDSVTVNGVTYDNADSDGCRDAGRRSARVHGLPRQCRRRVHPVSGLPRYGVDTDSFNDRIAYLTAKSCCARPKRAPSARWRWCWSGIVRATARIRGWRPTPRTPARTPRAPCSTTRTWTDRTHPARTAAGSRDARPALRHALHPELDDRFRGGDRPLPIHRRADRSRHRPMPSSTRSHPRRPRGRPCRRRAHGTGTMACDATENRIATPEHQLRAGRPDPPERDVFVSHAENTWTHTTGTGSGRCEPERLVAAHPYRDHDHEPARVLHGVGTGTKLRVACIDADCSATTTTGCPSSALSPWTRAPSGRSRSRAWNTT